MNIGANKHVSQVLCVLNSHPPDKTKYLYILRVYFCTMEELQIITETNKLCLRHSDVRKK